MSKQSISQPSHTKLVLSTATVTVEENSEGGAVLIQPTDLASLDVVLDANDSVRLAAFLNRFYTERNQAAQRTQAQSERRAAAARAVN